MPVTDTRMRRAGGMSQRLSAEEERRVGQSPECALDTNARVRTSGWEEFQRWGTDEERGIG